MWGFKYEKKLVRQILKAAIVLETMTIIIDSLGSKEKHCVHKELREFPKSSPNCQIAFSKDIYIFKVFFLYGKKQ